MTPAHVKKLKEIGWLASSQIVKADELVDDFLEEFSKLERVISEKETMSIEARAIEHLGVAVSRLRIAASILMQDHDRNSQEIADAINTATNVDNLMKAVCFNLSRRSAQKR